MIQSLFIASEGVIVKGLLSTCSIFTPCPKDVKDLAAKLLKEIEESDRKIIYLKNVQRQLRVSTTLCLSSHVHTQHLPSFLLCILWIVFVTWARLSVRKRQNFQHRLHPLKWPFIQWPFLEFSFVYSATERRKQKPNLCNLISGAPSWILRDMLLKRGKTPSSVSRNTCIFWVYTIFTPVLPEIQWYY